MNEQITTPTPWLRKPNLDGCSHRIHFGNQYPFPCIALVEENSTDFRNRATDIRLYPCTNEGRDAAASDLNDIETDKLKFNRERIRTEMLAGIRRKECRFCRNFPTEMTHTAIGDFLICKSKRGDWFTDDIIYNANETCDGFDLADKYKELSKEN